jgi:hypothetical protein
VDVVTRAYGYFRSKAARSTSGKVTCYLGPARYHRFRGDDDDPVYASITGTGGGT